MIINNHHILNKSPRKRSLKKNHNKKNERSIFMKKNAAETLPKGLRNFGFFGVILINTFAFALSCCLLGLWINFLGSHWILNFALLGSFRNIWYFAHSLQLQCCRFFWFWRWHWGSRHGLVLTSYKWTKSWVAVCLFVVNIFEDFLHSSNLCLLRGQSSLRFFQTLYVVFSIFLSSHFDRS